MGHLSLSSLILLLFAPFVAAQPDSEATSEANTGIKTFKATYDVYRKGKLMGQLNSQLKKIGANTYELSDITKGISGLASLVNFERTEITSFDYRKQQAEVISHNEKQKITFKSRFFEFNHTPGSENYQGTYKDKPFTLKSRQKLLTSHLLPWQLAQNVCHHQNNFSLPLLKSNEARAYRFKTRAYDNDKTLIERIYDASKDKRTETWVNHDNGCYVREINHYNGTEHIRTVLTDIEFTAP